MIKRSENGINALENFRTEYGNTALYNTLGGDKALSSAIASNNDSYLGTYIQAVMSADQLGGVDAFKANYNTNFLSDDQRLQAVMNELYGDRNTLNTYTRYKTDEDGDYIVNSTNDGYETEEYEDTEYNYVKQGLLERAAIGEEDYRNEVQQALKDSYSGWRKFWNGVLSFGMNLGAAIFDTIKDDIMFIAVGIESAWNRGALQRYMSGKGEFSSWGAGVLGDLMNSWDMQHSVLMKTDGTVTGWGNVIYGVTNTFGTMIPSMLLNLIPLGSIGSIASSAASTAVKAAEITAKVAIQSVYWYSIGVSNVKDYMEASPNASFSQICLTAFGVAAAQAAVTYANSFLFGSTTLEKATLGLNSSGGGLFESLTSKLRGGKAGAFFNSGFGRFVTDFLIEGTKQWYEEEWQEACQAIVEQFSHYCNNNFNQIFELSDKQYLNAMAMSFLTSFITMGFNYAGQAIKRIDNYSAPLLKNDDITFKGNNAINENGGLNKNAKVKYAKQSVKYTQDFNEAMRPFAEYSSEIRRDTEILEKRAKKNGTTVVEEFEKLPERQQNRFKAKTTAVVNAAETIGQFTNMMGEDGFKAAMDKLQVMQTYDEHYQEVMNEGGFSEYIQNVLNQVYVGQQIKGLEKVGGKLANARITQLKWILDPETMHANLVNDLRNKAKKEKEARTRAEEEAMSEEDWKEKATALSEDAFEKTNKAHEINERIKEKQAEIDNNNKLISEAAKAYSEFKETEAYTNVANDIEELESTRDKQQHAVESAELEYKDALAFKVSIEKDSNSTQAEIDEANAMANKAKKALDKARKALQKTEKALAKSEVYKQLKEHEGKMSAGLKADNDMRAELESLTKEYNSANEVAQEAQQEATRAIYNSYVVRMNSVIGQAKADAQAQVVEQIKEADAAVDEAYNALEEGINKEEALQKELQELQKKQAEFKNNPERAELEQEINDLRTQIKNLEAEITGESIEHDTWAQREINSCNEQIEKKEARLKELNKGIDEQIAEKEKQIKQQNLINIISERAYDEAKRAQGEARSTTDEENAREINKAIIKDARERERTAKEELDKATKELEEAANKEPDAKAQELENDREQANKRLANINKEIERRDKSGKKDGDANAKTRLKKASYDELLEAKANEESALAKIEEAIKANEKELEAQENKIEQRIEKANAEKKFAEGYSSFVTSEMRRFMGKEELSSLIQEVDPEFTPTAEAKPVAKNNQEKANKRLANINKEIERRDKSGNKDGDANAKSKLKRLSYNELLEAKANEEAALAKTEEKVTANEQELAQGPEDVQAEGGAIEEGLSLTADEDEIDLDELAKLAHPEEVTPEEADVDFDDEDNPGPINKYSVPSDTTTQNYFPKLGIAYTADTSNYAEINNAINSNTPFTLTDAQQRRVDEIKKKVGNSAVVIVSEYGISPVIENMNIDGKDKIHVFVPEAIFNDPNISVAQIFKQAAETSALYDIVDSELARDDYLVKQLGQLFINVYGRKNIEGVLDQNNNIVNDKNFYISVITNLLFNQDFTEYAFLELGSDLLQFYMFLPKTLEVVAQNYVSVADKQIRSKVIENLYERVCDTLIKIRRAVNILNSQALFHFDDMDSLIYQYAKLAGISTEKLNLMQKNKRTLPKQSQLDYASSEPDELIDDMLDLIGHKYCDSAIPDVTVGIFDLIYEIVNGRNIPQTIDDNLKNKIKKALLKANAEDLFKNNEYKKHITIKNIYEVKADTDITNVCSALLPIIKRNAQTFIKALYEMMLPYSSSKIFSVDTFFYKDSPLSKEKSLAATVFSKWAERNGLTRQVLEELYTNNKVDSSMPKWVTDTYGNDAKAIKKGLQEHFSSATNYTFEWENGKLPKIYTQQQYDSNGNIINPDLLTNTVGEIQGNQVKPNNMYDVNADYSQDINKVIDTIIDHNKVPLDMQAGLTLDDIIAFPELLSADAKAAISREINKEQSEKNWKPIDNPKISSVDVYQFLKSVLAVQGYELTLNANGYTAILKTVPYDDVFTPEFKKLFTVIASPNLTEPDMMNIDDLTPFIETVWTDGMNSQPLSFIPSNGNYVLAKSIPLSAIIKKEFFPLGNSDFYYNARVVFYAYDGNDSTTSKPKAFANGNDKTGGYSLSLSNEIFVKMKYNTGAPNVNGGNPFYSFDVETITHEAIHAILTKARLVSTSIGNSFGNVLSALRPDANAAPSDKKNYVTTILDLYAIIRDFPRETRPQSETDSDLDSKVTMCLFYMRANKIDEALKEISDIEKFVSYALYQHDPQEVAAWRHSAATFAYTASVIEDPKSNGTLRLSFFNGRCIDIALTNDAYIECVRAKIPRAFITYTGGVEDTFSKLMSEELNRFSIENDHKTQDILNGVIPIAKGENSNPVKNINNLNNKFSKDGTAINITSDTEKTTRMISQLLHDDSIPEEVKKIYQTLNILYKGMKKGPDKRIKDYGVEVAITDILSNTNPDEMDAAVTVNSALYKQTHQLMYHLVVGDHGTISYEDFLNMPVPAYFTISASKNSSYSNYVGAVVQFDNNISLSKIMETQYNTLPSRTKNATIQMGTIKFRDVIAMNSDGMAIINLEGLSSQEMLNVVNGEIQNTDKVSEEYLQIIRDQEKSGNGQDQNIPIYKSDNSVQYVSFEAFKKSGLYVNEIKNIKSNQLIFDFDNGLVYILYDDGPTMNMFAEPIRNNSHLTLQSEYDSRLNNFKDIGPLQLDNADIMDIQNAAIDVYQNPDVPFIVKDKLRIALQSIVGFTQETPTITTPSRLNMVMENGASISLPVIERLDNGAISITDAAKTSGESYSPDQIRTISAVNPEELEQQPTDTESRSPIPQETIRQIQEGTPNLIDTDLPEVQTSYADDELEKFVIMDSDEFRKTISEMSFADFSNFRASLEIYLFKTYGNDNNNTLLTEMKLKVMNMASQAYRTNRYTREIPASDTIAEFYTAMDGKRKALIKNGELSKEDVLRGYFEAKSAKKTNAFLKYLKDLSFAELQSLRSQLENISIVSSYLEYVKGKNADFNLDLAINQVMAIHDMIDSDIGLIALRQKDVGVTEGLLPRGDMYMYVEITGNQLSNILVMDHKSKQAYVRMSSDEHLGLLRSHLLDFVGNKKNAMGRYILVDDLLGVINQELATRSELDKEYIATQAKEAGADVAKFTDRLKYNKGSRNSWLAIFAARSFADSIEPTGRPVGESIKISELSEIVNYDKEQQTMGDQLIIATLAMTDPFVASMTKRNKHSYQEVAKAEKFTGMGIYSTEYMQQNGGLNIGYAGIYDLLQTKSLDNINKIMPDLWRKTYRLIMGKDLTKVEFTYKDYLVFNKRLSGVLTDSKTKNIANIYNIILKPLMKSCAAYYTYAMLFNGNSKLDISPELAEMSIIAAMPKFFQYEYLCNNVQDNEYGLSLSILQDAYYTMPSTLAQVYGAQLLNLADTLKDITKQGKKSGIDNIVNADQSYGNIGKEYTALVNGMRDSNLENAFWSSEDKEEAKRINKSERTLLQLEHLKSMTVKAYNSDIPYTLTSYIVPDYKARGTNIERLGFMRKGKGTRTTMSLAMQGFIVEADTSKLSPYVLNMIEEVNKEQRPRATRRGANVTLGVTKFNNNHIKVIIGNASSDANSSTYVNDYTFKLIKKYFYPTQTSIKSVEELNQLTNNAENVFAFLEMVKELNQEGNTNNPLYSYIDSTANVSLEMINEAANYIQSNQELSELYEAALDKIHNSNPNGTIDVDMNYLQRAIMNNFFGTMQSLSDVYWSTWYLAYNQIKRKAVSGHAAEMSYVGTQRVKGHNNGTIGMSTGDVTGVAISLEDVGEYISDTGAVAEFENLDFGAENIREYVMLIVQNEVMRRIATDKDLQGIMADGSTEEKLGLIDNVADEIQKKIDDMNDKEAGSGDAWAIREGTLIDTKNNVTLNDDVSGFENALSNSVTAESVTNRASLIHRIKNAIDYINENLSKNQLKELAKEFPDLFITKNNQKILSKNITNRLPVKDLESILSQLERIKTSYKNGEYTPSVIKNALATANRAVASKERTIEKQKETIKEKKAENTEQRKRLNELEKEHTKDLKIRASYEELQGKYATVALVTKKGIKIPSIVKRIMQSAVDEEHITKSKVQWTEANTENIVVDIDDFLKENTLSLGMMREEDVMEVVNYLNDNISGILANDINYTKRYNAYMFWLIAYIKSMNERGLYDFNAEENALIETVYENRASLYGSNLNAVKLALERFRPMRTVVNEMRTSYGLELDEATVEALGDTLDLTIGDNISQNDLIIKTQSDSPDMLKKFKKNPDGTITITKENKAELVGYALKAATQEALQKVSKNYATGHAVEQVFAWEQMCMLSWPGTWVRNIASNFVLQSTNYLSDRIGAMFGKGKIVKKRIARIQSYIEEQNNEIPENSSKPRKNFFMYQIVGTKVSSEMREAVKNLFDSTISIDPDTGAELTFWKTLSSSASRYSNWEKVASWGNNPTGQTLVKMIIQALTSKTLAENRFATTSDSEFKQKMTNVLNTTSHLLFKMLSDVPWIKKTTTSLFERMLTERGITPEDVDYLNLQVLEVFVDAYVEASWQYMHRASPMSKFDDAVKEKLGKAGWFMWKQIMPFANATWNWGMEAINYSPVGLVRGIMQLCRLDKTYIANDKKIDTGDARPSGSLSLYNARKMIGKGTIGTMLMALGMGAAALGIIGIDKEDDKIKLYFGNDTYVDVTSLFGTSAFLAGAGFIYTLCNTDDNTSTKLWGAITTLLSSLLEDSIFNDLMQSFAYSNNIGEWVTYNAINAFGLFVPNLYKKLVESSYDFTIQYDNGILGQIERFGTKIIPGLAYTFPRVYNIYTGETESTYKIPFLFKIMNSLSPINIEPYRVSDIEATALAYGISKGQLTGQYEDIGTLTTRQKALLNQMYGSLNKETLGDLISGKTAVRVQNEDGSFSTLKWSKMTNKQRSAAINSIMTKNAAYSKVYIWTSALGGTYYATESEYSALKSLGITRKVYLANDVKSGFV